MNTQPSSLVVDTPNDECSSRQLSIPGAVTFPSVDAIRELLLNKSLTARFQQWSSDVVAIASNNNASEEVSRLLTVGSKLLAEMGENVPYMRCSALLTQMLLRHKNGTLYTEDNAWETELAYLEQCGEPWSFAAMWMRGKIYSVRAGNASYGSTERMETLQMAFAPLRDACLKMKGVKLLPLPTLLLGAEVDASLYQSDDERRTPRVSTLPPPYRLCDAIGITLAYCLHEEDPKKHADQIDAILYICDAMRERALQDLYANNPAHDFLRYNLLLNQYIANAVLRDQHEELGLLEIIHKNIQASTTLSLWKKLEWELYIAALRTLQTENGDYTLLLIDRALKENPQCANVLRTSSVLRACAKEDGAIREKLGISF